VIKEQLNREVDAFVAVIDEMYGYYLDAVMAFGLYHRFILEGLERTKAHFPPGTNLSDNAFIGQGDPGDPSHFLEHRTTKTDLISRNAPGGRNNVLAAQHLVVLIFTFWDARYRSAIANVLGLKVDDLKVPLVGDLRRLRNDIVHGRGRISKETAAKLEVMTHFKEGDEILLGQDAVRTLVQSLKSALDSLVVNAGGADPGHGAVLQLDGITVRPKPTL
jgi:hypothetical protein